ncbi:MAG: GyrI-like domain-containing protein [Propionibacteriaceae bacterium]|jgi:hypothetical protein|nr:GyrI-like domain-containing protein [Propionibacteriaceae bacterium]
MAIDVKKTQKQLYQATPTPAVVEVPTLTYIMVDGQGDPNANPDYQAALEAMYAVAYGVKMAKMGDWRPEGYYDFVVAPLEGLWTTVDGDPYVTGVTDKSQFKWTMMVQMPDFVTAEVLATVAEGSKRKKPDLDLDQVRVDTLAEGLCAQILHIGGYDDEPATIAVLHQAITKSGHVVDLGGGRRHQEIYLSDPRRVPEDKLKTIIRLPIATA